MEPTLAKEPTKSRQRADKEPTGNNEPTKSRQRADTRADKEPDKEPTGLTPNHSLIFHTGNPRQQKGQAASVWTRRAEPDKIRRRLFWGAQPLSLESSLGHSHSSEERSRP